MAGIDMKHLIQSAKVGNTVAPGGHDTSAQTLGVHVLEHALSPLSGVIGIQFRSGNAQFIIIGKQNMVGAIKGSDGEQLHIKVGDGFALGIQNVDPQ